MKKNFTELKRDELSLWQKLHIPEGSSELIIDEAYREVCKEGKANNQPLRIAWKILRDPYYRSAYYYFGSLKKIYEAGFFDDGAPFSEDEINQKDSNWLTTPTHKIQKHFHDLTQQENFEENNKPLAVLLTTGAFSPIHQGHLEMMELAKQGLENDGFQVIGGYLSPCHQTYVTAKYNKNEVISLAERLQLCQEIVESSPWLMIDTWESSYNNRTINFTEVIERLEQYLSQHIPSKKPIQIAYVYGSDNAGFSSAFVSKGRAVCIRRPGYEKQIRMLQKDFIISKNKNIILSKKSTSKPTISSTLIRGKNKTDSIQNKNFPFVQKDKINMSTVKYLMRDEGDWSILPWVKSRNLNKIRQHKREFLKNLVKLFKNGFRHVKSPDLAFNLEIIILNLEEQNTYMIKHTQFLKTLSLDSCVEGTFNFKTSRMFFISDNQKESAVLIARPGSENIETQLQKIPDGQYVLVEDDIDSGQTFQAIVQLLPKRIKIQQTLILSQITKNFINRVTSSDQEEHILDIVDSRDFLVGSREAGLVVLLPNGQIARAPYMLPYVSLINRAKIPPSNELYFSIKLWEFNLKFFRKIEPPILLSEAHPSFQILMKYVGFKENASMEYICEWHLEKLNVNS